MGLELGGDSPLAGAQGARSGEGARSCARVGLLGLGPSGSQRGQRFAELAEISETPETPAILRDMQADDGFAGHLNLGCDCLFVEPQWFCESI